MRALELEFEIENYACKIDIVQNLCEFCLLFWTQNVLMPRMLLMPSDENMSILFVYNKILGILGQFAQKIIHEDLIQFKNLHEL